MVNGHIRGENKVTFSELRKAPQSQKHHRVSLKHGCGWYSPARFTLGLCFSTFSKTQNPTTWRLYVCDIHI